jgi:hypothetical protein
MPFKTLEDKRAYQQVWVSKKRQGDSILTVTEALRDRLLRRLWGRPYVPAEEA